MELNATMQAWFHDMLIEQGALLEVKRFYLKSLGRQ